jgi:hypothetical protein
MPLRSPRKLRTELPGQSGPALPRTRGGPFVPEAVVSPRRASRHRKEPQDDASKLLCIISGISRAGCHVHEPDGRAPMAG